MTKSMQKYLAGKEFISKVISYHKYQHILITEKPYNTITAASNSTSYGPWRQKNLNLLLLFDLILYVPVNNLSFISGQVFLGWTSTKLCVLLKNTRQWHRWGWKPRPFGLESSTLPLNLLHVNNKGADQPVHPHRLISTFVIRFLESIIAKLATIISEADQARLSVNWSKPRRRVFLWGGPYGPFC